MTARLRAALAVLALVGAGCATPRQRSCRALTLAVAETDAARRFDPTGSFGPNPLRYQGARAVAAAQWVRSMSADGDLAAAAEALATATDAYGRAVFDLEGVVTWLRARTRDAPIPATLGADIAGVQTDVETVVRHCSALLVAPGPVSTECAALQTAVQACLAPAPGVRTGDHYRRCVTDLAKVHGPDAFERALARLRARLEQVTPIADAVDAPAGEVVVRLGGAVRAMSALEDASSRSREASTKIQSLCAP